MANEKKMTKMEKIAHILTIPGIAEDSIAMEYLLHEQELLEKKNSGEHKPTKTQMANAELRKTIVEVMEPNRRYTVTEMIKVIPELGEYSPQKITAQLRPMVDAGQVHKTTEKRVSYYWVEG